MDRAVVAGVRVRPSARRLGRDVVGFDEDAFTLTVAAVESLAPGPAPETLHLVGGGANGPEWALREALGSPRLQIRRHAPGAPSLFAVLTDATHARAEGDDLVVAVDEGNEVDGAGAVGFRVAARPGSAVLGHRERGHPDWKRPDAGAWTDAGRQALGEAADGAGTLLLVAPTAPPVLLQRWSEGMARFPVALAPPLDPGVGDSETLRAALAVYAASGGGTDTVVLLAMLEPARSTAFLALRRQVPVPWDGDWAGSSERPEAAPRGGIVPEAAEAVSQGAYLPHATYLAELPSRWRLAADRCAACSGITFPVRSYCRHCGANDRLERIELPRGNLEVLATTTVAPGAQPTEFDPQVARSGPYDVVLVGFEAGVRGTLQATDAPARTLHVGDRVDTRLRRLYATEGEWRYGLKAVPSPVPAPRTPAA